MKREDIIKELVNRGYKAEVQNTIKNGIEFEGIKILTDSNVAPVIYTEAIIEKAEKENKTLDCVVDDIVDIYENNRDLEFDVNVLFNHDFILKHIYIALQKDSTEEIIKRPCDLDGIESYLYVRGDMSDDGSFSVKVTKAILDQASIAEDEAWEMAEKHTYAETSLESLAKIMADMMGSEYTEDMNKRVPLFVLTNKCKIKGASAILNKKVLAEFGEHYDTDKLIVLPSSIHEMLIVPYESGMDISSFSSMVEEVNCEQVDPTERLTDRAYVIAV